MLAAVATGRNSALHNIVNIDILRQIDFINNDEQHFFFSIYILYIIIIIIYSVYVISNLSIIS